MPAHSQEASVTCSEALHLIGTNFAALPQLAEHAVPLADAGGRILARAVIADRDQPPFSRSTRDGFAIVSSRQTNVAAEPTQTAMHLVGAIRAGEAWEGKSLQIGEAVEIMTGAPVPAGADAVLMVEHAKRQGDEITTAQLLSAGSNIVPRGAEARAGDVLLEAGVRLGPAELALAASVGCAELAVYARPAVAILSTGDELVEVDEMPGVSQIRNSNAYALAALVRQHGGEPQILPIATDSRESLGSVLDRALGAQMLLVSGGVSAGKFDLVEPVLLSRGAEFCFTGVAMQPGKPAVFGRIAQPAGTQWIFGLPGNPVSTQVTAMLFAMPMLRALGGEREPRPVFGAAILADTVQVKAGLTRFLPARLESTLLQTTVRPTGWQGSGDLNGNARGNCYLVVPPEADRLAAGSAVQVLLR